MELGTGIFLSTAILCLTVIFTVTRGKWNWQRGLLQFFIGSVGLSVIGVGFYYWNNQPKQQTTFLKINLGDSKQDVIFHYGKPNKYSTDSDWHYSEEEKREDGMHITFSMGIKFQDSRVRFISLGAGPQYIGNIKIEGSTDQVFAEFGKKCKVLSTKDGFTRIYSYPQYKTFFVVDSDKVIEMGIYEPRLGPMTFVDEGGENKTPFPGGRMLPMILAVK